MLQVGLFFSLIEAVIFHRTDAGSTETPSTSKKKGAQKYNFPCPNNEGVMMSRPSVLLPPIRCLDLLRWSSRNSSRDRLLMDTFRYSNKSWGFSIMLIFASGCLSWRFTISMAANIWATFAFPIPLISNE